MSSFKSILPDVWNALIEIDFKKANINSTSDDKNSMATMIRLDTDVRSFYEMLSNNIGVSMQVTMAFILKGVMKMQLEGNLPKYIYTSKKYKESIAEKFLNIFTVHNVPIFNVSSLLKDFDITYSVLTNRGILSSKIDDHVIKFVSDLFNIRELWLRDGTGNPHSKMVISNSLAYYLTLLNQCKLEIILIVDETILTDNIKDTRKNRVVHPVIKYTKTYNNVSSDYFIICESLNWDYKQDRKYLSLLTKAALFKNNHVRSIATPKQYIFEVFSGNAAKNTLDLILDIQTNFSNFNYEKDLSIEPCNTRFDSFKDTLYKPFEESQEYVNHNLNKILDDFKNNIINGNCNPYYRDY